MTLIDRIVKEHEQLRDLLGRIIDTTDGAERKRLFAEAMAKVEAHERAEEASIYEMLVADLDMRPLALQALQEHKVGRMVLDELSRTDFGDAWWMPRLIVANNILVMHMQVEEGNILPIVNRVAGPEQGDRLLDEFDVAERDVFVHFEENFPHVIRSTR